MALVRLNRPILRTTEQHLGPPRDNTPMTLAELAAELIADHPEWRTGSSRFLPRLTQAVKRAGSPDAINAEDLLLATAALDKIDAAVAELDRRLAKVAAAAAARFKSDPGFRDELLQAARVKILVGSPQTGPALQRYGGEGALQSWLKVVVTSTAVDLRRSHHPERQEDSEERLTDVAAHQLSPDDALAHGGHRTALTAALKKSIAALDTESRVLLRLRFVDGNTVDEAARALGVHRTTAMRRLEKAQADLLEAVREDLKIRLGLRTRELESLMRTLRPSLAERLSRLILRPTFD